MNEDSELKIGMAKVISAMIAGEARVMIVTIAAITLWGLCLYEATPLRIFAAAGFSVLVFLPMLLADNRRVK